MPMNPNTLIADAAQQYNLPEWLIRAIIQVESSGNPWAMRYERNFYTLYIVRMEIHPIAPCSLYTEKVSRATSWGLMQVMGQVARERGFAGPFLSTLLRPEIGIDYGCRQLAYLVKRFKVSDSWDPVIRAYNSGNPRADNLDYVKKVNAARE